MDEHGEGKNYEPNSNPVCLKIYVALLPGRLNKKLVGTTARKTLFKRVLKALVMKEEK